MLGSFLYQDVYQDMSYILLPTKFILIYILSKILFASNVNFICHDSESFDGSITRQTLKIKRTKH